ncbi:hypothetical protein RRG08_029693 [Elysia crispata]|uniref:Uncharacterized protein n=1 Tax=Elysia crispata TaxID=231223 RepID=A0AAE0Y6R7_9GAST|nr:hypothetical protein RRG08_029693 [Elysia crispata]
MQAKCLSQALPQTDSLASAGKITSQMQKSYEGQAYPACTPDSRDQIWGARHRDGANRMTYKDVCKRDLKICSIIPGNLESTAANDVGIRLSRSAPSKLR